MTYFKILLNCQYILEKIKTEKASPCQHDTLFMIAVSVVAEHGIEGIMLSSLRPGNDVFPG